MVAEAVVVATWPTWTTWGDIRLSSLTPTALPPELMATLYPLGPKALADANCRRTSGNRGIAALAAWTNRNLPVY